MQIAFLIAALTVAVPDRRDLSPNPVDPFPERILGDWKLGGSNWTMDYPRSDRHLSEAVRRLTRINTRSVEQVVDLDGTDDVYNWPFLYAVQAGEWGLTEKQGAILREYVNRGGFFVGDDFHGVDEWGEFDKRVHATATQMTPSIEFAGANSLGLMMPTCRT